MDWKTPSDDSPESTTAPNRRCTVSSCARSSPAPLPTWPGNDSDSRLKKAGTNIYRKSGDCPKTPKKTHTHKWYIYIYILYIYWYIIILYILYIIYIIYYIDIVCSFLSGIDRGLFWDLLCNPSSSMPVCLDCPASSASSRARSWETLLVQGSVTLQWLSHPTGFGGCSAQTLSLSDPVPAYPTLVRFTSAPIRCQKKYFRAQHLGSWLGNP